VLAWIAYTPNPVLLNLQVITTERWLGTLNLQEWTMQEWTYQHGMSRVDIAGMDLSAWYGKGGQCGSGQSEHVRTQLAETDFLAGVDSLL